MMNTYEYNNWIVSAEDILYKRLKDENKNITNDDTETVSLLITKFLPKKRIAIDVGCHYGFFTKFLSTKFEWIHAFDFDNDIMECFKKNMDKFQVQNLTTHRYGLGMQEMSVATNDFFPKKGRRGPLGNHVDPGGVNKTQKIKSLDQLQIKDVDLIMIDTEGYELNVIKGAEETIKKFKPMLIVEFHNRNLTKKFGYSLADLKTYIENLGYESQGFINTVDQVFTTKK